MDEKENTRYWEANAEAWTYLSRRGYDRCRDLINLPRFFEMLPPIDGLRGLDIGCGEGTNTRAAARLGARMTAIDIAPTFLRHACESETTEPLGIDYLEASGTQMPFENASFDFVMATMSLMDIPEPERALAEAFRVLRPGGFIQFSICHPCFQTRKFAWQRDENGRKTAVLAGDYWNRSNGDWIEEWHFGAAPAEERNRFPKFRIPRFTRTLSEWLNALIETGFVIHRINEPRPTEETLAAHPEEYDALIIPLFLQIRADKPLR
ncbi:MAG: class I SAM-dependent methyltransferase [Phycisphaerales bacterium]|nr:class I SAM-dependent methyltransferase [Phycisphaerales bacterium]